MVILAIFAMFKILSEKSLHSFPSYKQEQPYQICLQLNQRELVDKSLQVESLDDPSITQSVIF